MNEVKHGNKTHFLDISEEVCPMSFMLTKDAISNIADGEVIEVLCRAGDPVRNISIQMKDEGHLIKAVTKVGNTHFRLKIEKSGLLKG